MPYFWGLCADCCLTASMPEEASRAIENALRIAHKTGEHWCLADLYRLHGLVHLRLSGNVELALSCFRRSRRVAKRQGAAALVKLVAEEGARAVKKFGTTTEH